VNKNSLNMVVSHATYLHSLPPNELFRECLETYKLNIELRNEIAEVNGGPEVEEVDVSFQIERESNDGGFLNESLKPNEIVAEVNKWSAANFVAALHEPIKELGLYRVRMISQPSYNTIKYHDCRIWVVPTSDSE